MQELIEQHAINLMQTLGLGASCAPVPGGFRFEVHGSKFVDGQPIHAKREVVIPADRDGWRGMADAVFSVAAELGRP